MEYKKIVAITGLNGLFELLNSKTDGAIVRSLEDNSTKFVSSRMHNFSHLESIEVYTVKDNVNLGEVFRAMEQSNQPLPDLKANSSVVSYFQAVFPDLDFDRVYASDMKKMVKWFSALQGKVEFTTSADADAEEAAPEAETAEKPVSEVKE